MESVLNVLLIRFAIIAAAVAAVAVVVFAVFVHLKRRGKWDQARRRAVPVAARAVDWYAQRSQGAERSSRKRRAFDVAARRLHDDQSDR